MGLQAYEANSTPTVLLSTIDATEVNEIGQCKPANFYLGGNAAVHRDIYPYYVYNSAKLFLLFSKMGAS